MRVSGKSRRNWSAGPRVLARTESSPTQSGTKQGGPSRDHWAKLGRLQYTRTQYSPVMIALFSMNFIAPPSRKKSSSASACDAWAVHRPKNAPEPTALHLDFIRASEEEAEARSSAQRKQLEAMAAAQADRETALNNAEDAQR